MSVNDLVKEEVNRQIDVAIEAIPHDTKSYGDPVRWSKLLFNNLNDFLLGYEVGYVVYAGMMYYKDQVIERGIKVDEEQDIQVRKDIETVIVDRLPEIQQAILRAVTAS